MRQARFEGFDGWRKVARGLLMAECPPDEVTWVEASDPQPVLSFLKSTPAPAGDGGQFRVPREFLVAARTVAAHSDPERWSLMYRILWRVTHGEPRLLDTPTEADVLRFTDLRHQVQKEVHRMQAFVRFRQTRVDGEPWFVAWYEPQHDVLDLNADFFTARFASMRWSILTPGRCMHWDGKELSFSPGVSRAAAPTGDDLEAAWIAYYSSIFNPARLNPSALQAHLPRRHWRNLPEARVIEPLMKDAGPRTAAMLERSEFLRVRDSDYSPAQPPPGADVATLREAAAACRACPLWKMASCTVFGEGPASARVVLVGEQPGDHEDRAGRPFVGPAGQLLDRALAAAGVDRAALYVTNAVKHFKFEPRGKRRIHQTPNSRDIAACRPWLMAEIAQIRPRLVVALGATAAQSILEMRLKVTEERGRVLNSASGPTLVTIHPSALLRTEGETDAAAGFERFVADLREMRRTM